MFINFYLFLLHVMVYPATVEDIEQEYARLKQGSRGREAVNPQDFVRYVRRVNLDLDVVPNIGLLEMLDTSELYWRFICDRAHLGDLISPTRRLQYEWQISGHHFEGRRLRLLEVMEGFSFNHHILETLTEHNPYFG